MNNKYIPCFNLRIVQLQARVVLFNVIIVQHLVFEALYKLLLTLMLHTQFQIYESVMGLYRLINLSLSLGVLQHYLLVAFVTGIPVKIQYMIIRIISICI